MPYKVIQVGTGGWGNSWCRRFLPSNARDGLIEVVAAVDVNPDALKNAREGLGLRVDQCYIESSRTGQPVQVQRFLAEARGQTVST